MSDVNTALQDFHVLTLAASDPAQELLRLFSLQEWWLFGGRGQTWARYAHEWLSLLHTCPLPPSAWHWHHAAFVPLRHTHKHTHRCHIVGNYTWFPPVLHFKRSKQFPKKVKGCSPLCSLTSQTGGVVWKQTGPFKFQRNEENRKYKPKNGKAVIWDWRRQPWADSMLLTVSEMYRMSPSSK